TIEANGAAYLAAMNTLEQNEKAAAPLFDAVAKNGGGFAVLARFQQANAALKAGDKGKAADLFTAIANDGSVDKAFKDLAAILAGLVLLDEGKPAEAAKLVQPLSGD